MKLSIVPKIMLLTILMQSLLKSVIS